MTLAGSVLEGVVVGELREVVVPRVRVPAVAVGRAGPRGTGKTSLARILAKALNCAQGPTPDPDKTCHACRAIAGASPAAARPSTGRPCA